MVQMPLSSRSFLELILVTAKLKLASHPGIKIGIKNFLSCTTDPNAANCDVNLCSLKMLALDYLKNKTSLDSRGWN